MLRRVVVSVGCCMGVILAGCGGGRDSSQGSGNGGGSNPASTKPTITSIVPSAVTAGAPGLTLTIYGSNFLSGDTVQWSGATRTTTFVSDGQLTTTIPSTDLVNSGTAQITVTDVSSPAIASNSKTFTIAPQASPATWVRQVQGVAVPFDIAWDAAHGELYASVSAADPNAANTIVAIDPVSGKPGAQVKTGINPQSLAISSDSSFLWAGIDGDNALQRFTLPGLVPDIKFPLPKNWLGAGQTAFSLDAAPVSPHTVALVAGAFNSSGGNGVYVYDDATQRPTYVPGFGPGGGPQIDRIRWGKDDSTLYAIGGFNGILSLQVNSSGVSWNGTGGGLALDINTIEFNRNNGLVYSVPRVDDPVQNTQVGQFDVPLPDTACTSDSALNRYYCFVVYSIGGSDVFASELWVYDLTTYALLHRYSFGYLEGEAATQTTASVTGAPIKLLRWGRAGLALLTSGGAEWNVPNPGYPYGNGGIFLIDGAAVDPNVTADAPSGNATSPIPFLESLSPQQATAGSAALTLTITGRDFTVDDIVFGNYNFISQIALPTTFVSTNQLVATIPAAALQSAGPLRISVQDQHTGQLATDSLTFTVVSPSSGPQITALDLAAYAMAWDPVGNMLYVGTGDVDAQYPNSIVAIGGNVPAIQKAQFVQPNPVILSLAARSEFLYAAYADDSQISQFPLPGLDHPLTWSLRTPPNQGAYLAGDMKAAPVDPHTVAVSLFSWGSTPREQGGVAIFDDSTLRPDVVPGWGTVSNPFPPPLYDNLAWSSSDQLLTAVSVDSDGGSPLYAMQIDPLGGSYLSQGTSILNAAGDWGLPIHSDSGTNLVYCDNGNVADPATQSIVGNLNASGIVLPVSSLNRVFIIGQTAAQANTTSFTIESFDQETYTPVSSITLQNLLGYPIALERWGASGLALLTLNHTGGGWGGSFGMLYLIQDSNFVSSAPAVKASINRERVQQRWKPLTRANLRELIHHRRSATFRSPRIGGTSD